MKRLHSSWEISAILASYCPLHLPAATREVRVRDKPSFPMIFINSLDFDWHSRSIKTVFSAYTIKVRPPGSLPTILWPLSLVYWETWDHPLLALFLPFLLSKPIALSLIFLFVSGHSFFIFFVGFSFSSLPLKFYFSWDFVLSLHGSLICFIPFIPISYFIFVNGSQSSPALHYTPALCIFLLCTSTWWSHGHIKLKTLLLVRIS